MELLLERHRVVSEGETALVSRARAGDKAAFQILHRQTVDRIYGFCLRIVADVPLAEELTQTVFVRAWENLDSFRGEGEFYSWLHRIAVNVVILNHRSNQRRLARVEYSDDLENFSKARSLPSPEAGIDLEQAIARLPERARTILILYDLEGFRHDEIARLLDIAPGTSKSQLHRAHQLLKAWLEQ